MNNLCPEIDKACLGAGMELLRQPVLPLVSMLQFVFLTGPFATVAEVINEMPEPIETQFALYSHPRLLLRRHEGSLRLLESIKNGAVPEVKVVGENGDKVDAMTTLSSLCLQQVLTGELEEINSLLCAPCGCDLCCVGPTPAMKQEFFEIPLADSETELFIADRLDTKNSRRCTARTEPPLLVEGRPFYTQKTPGLFHWRDGWSLIVPKSSRCPNLETEQGRCLIYENRPEVCRRPQIFPYILEKQPGSGPRPVYRLRNSLLAVIDCPYVVLLKDEIAAYGAACELDVIFTHNKA
ncbi:MAG TPA: YkgJ family cysteine cluster protein [Desulfobulbaceae bacterium]|nr:YkgJ family cysteine cluster protein [Desulfobulbaceae bacterium]